MPRPRQARTARGKQKSSSAPPSAVRIGLVAGEPIRMEGLRSIFDQPAMPGHAPLIPIVGTMDDLLSNRSIEFLVVDMHSASGSLDTLQSVRRVRADMRQIVIGPENDEELVLNCVVAGARAYLDSSASPETVRQAIEIVVSGSIWAPRKLLSRLIDRLLDIPRSMVQTSSLRLSEREQQVMELVLLARTNREIALQLGIEERTVKAHMGNLMKKTGAENRIDLSVRAINRSLIPGRRAQTR
jgi:DNA-binding NarL/FixJ family response regulator